MCLYTKYVLNPKYKPNKKNHGKPPACKDKRLLYVPVKCGRCMECRKQKQREWVTRLAEEIRNDNRGLFVTLTINDENFEKLRENEHEDGNDICTRAVRRFLERIRKETKKSVKHWAITELGDEKGRYHLHGIFFCNPMLIKRHWKYGFVFIGTWVNEATVFYITKYMMKKNEHDPNFIGKVLASKGIGSGYFRRADANNNRYQAKKTNETYRLRNGTKISLPQYYRNKIYSDTDKEKLWIEKQERGYRYIMGVKVNVDDEKTYNQWLEHFQQMGIDLYKDNPDEWDAAKQRERLRKMRLYRERMKGK